MNHADHNVIKTQPHRLRASEVRIVLRSACERPMEEIVRVGGHASALADKAIVLTDCSEAWRYTGPFSRWNRFKGSFPGLGIATVAFAGYLAYEAVFVKDEHGHGEIGQGKDHHGIAT